MKLSSVLEIGLVFIIVGAVGYAAYTLWPRPAPDTVEYPGGNTTPNTGDKRKDDLNKMYPVLDPAPVLIAGGGSGVVATGPIAAIDKYKDPQAVQ